MLRFYCEATGIGFEQSMLQWDDSLLSLLANTAQQVVAQPSAGAEPMHRTNADSSFPLAASGSNSEELASAAERSASPSESNAESGGACGGATAVGGMEEVMLRRSSRTRLPTPLQLHRGAAVESLGAESGGGGGGGGDPFGTWRPWFEGVLSSSGFVKLSVSRGRHQLLANGSLARSPLSPLDGLPVPPQLQAAVERAERYYVKLLQFAHRF